MNYLLAIDQGTSSTRAMLYTSEGQLITTSQYCLTQSYPHHGWVEQDPEEIWLKTLKAITDVLGQVDAQKVLTCGITNQRETTVIWDKQTGRCLAPALVWQDRRTQDFCDSLIDYTSMLQEKTGLLPDPYFSASKLNWLLTTIPEARELAAKNQLAFGTIDSFLLWRLTKGKVHATDITNASRTLLYNIFSQQWDEDLLKLFAIPASVLPIVHSSDYHFGFIDNTFFGYSIPITAILGDQQAALIGQRCFKDGMVKATFGTGGFLLMNTGTRPVLSTHHLLTTIAYQIKGQVNYGLEGSLYQAGTTVKWLRDEMKLIETSAETEFLAASLDSNDGVYLIPSFTGLGAPHWIALDGAMIVGLSRTSNRAHIARAALESVCYQTRDILACMREDSRLDLSVLRVDGGMSVNSWFLQFLATQCNLSVERPKDTETTAEGIAILAALSLGLVDSLDSLEKNWDAEKNFKPETCKTVDYQGWQRIIHWLKRMDS